MEIVRLVLAFTVGMFFGVIVLAIAKAAGRTTPQPATEVAGQRHDAGSNQDLRSGKAAAASTRYREPRRASM